MPLSEGGVRRQVRRVVVSSHALAFRAKQVSCRLVEK